MKRRRRGRIALAVVAMVLWVAAPRLALHGISPPSADGYVPVPDGRLAYEVLGGPLARDDVSPVVFVHGGPGVATRSGDRRALQALAEDRPVVLYDQIGAGASSRLDDPSGYSLERAVADLEGLRAGLGLDAMVLLGHSWGTTVSAHYAARHPGLVDDLVLIAPGSADWDPEVADDPSLRLVGSERLRLYSRLLNPRSLAMYGLTLANPAIAHWIGGDREMDRRFAAILAATAPGLFCDASLGPTYPVDGVGYYASQVPQIAQEPVRLPVPAHPVSALIVKPECDYLPWSIIDRYVDIFDARVALVPGAGHAAHLERPGAITELITSYLAGADLEGEIQRPFTIPASYQGPE